MQGHFGEGGSGGCRVGKHNPLNYLHTYSVKTGTTQIRQGPRYMYIKHPIVFGRLSMFNILTWEPSGS